jgi:hypothetical protein
MPVDRLLTRATTLPESETEPRTPISDPLDDIPTHRMPSG